MSTWGHFPHKWELILRRRKWQPTPVLLPGKSHGQRILVGYSPWGRKESDTTERLHFHFLSGGHCLLRVGGGEEQKWTRTIFLPTFPILPAPTRSQWTCTEPGAQGLTFSPPLSSHAATNSEQTFNAVSLFYHARHPAFAKHRLMLSSS